MARVVVVGAGVAGLAATIRLADLGHAVTLVERAPTVGGGLAPLTAPAPGHEPSGADEIAFGPTTFTLPAVLRDLFRTTGRPLERVLDLVPVEPATRYAFADGTVLDLPNASRAGAIDAVSAVLGSTAAQQWDSTIQAAGAIWDVVRPRVLDVELSTAAALRLAAARTPATRSGTLGRFAAQHLDDARLRAVLAAHAVSAGADPARAPAALAVLPYVEQTFGVWSVAGGIRHLVDALERRALERGAVVLTGQPVTAVRLAGHGGGAGHGDGDGGRVSGRVEGVELGDGRRIGADVVVSAVDVDHLRRDLLPSPRTRRTGRGSRRRPGRSIASFALDLGIDDAFAAAASQLPARTVVPPEVGVEFLELDSGVAANPHIVVAHLTCPPHGTGAGELDWSDPSVVDANASAVVSRLAARGLVPPSARVVRVVSPRDREAATGARGGRVPSSSWLASGAIRGRPGNRSRVRGLFQAGASVHPGSTLPLAVASAAIVADLVGRA